MGKLVPLNTGKEENNHLAEQTSAPIVAQGQRGRLTQIGTGLASDKLTGGQSDVRQNDAASDKLTESEYNRSTAMQRKHGSYQSYLVGATADGKYYSQPKLGMDMERKYNTVTNYEANAKKKAEELQSANEAAGNLYTKLNELSGKLPELQQYAGSSAIASGIVQQMQQEYASTLKQYEDATKAVDAAYAAY